MIETEEDLSRRREDLTDAVNRIVDTRGVGLVSTVEDSYLLSGARLCFLRAADVGAIFCAHASCERDLAAMVDATDFKPRGWERWGLGPLVKHSSEHLQMPEEVAVKIFELNESRKALYHFGHSEADASLSRATSAYVHEVGSETLFAEFRARQGRDGRTKDVWRYAMDRVLEAKALAAIEAALKLRSWLAVTELPDDWV